MTDPQALTCGKCAGDVFYFTDTGKYDNRYDSLYCIACEQRPSECTECICGAYTWRAWLREQTLIRQCLGCKRIYHSHAVKQVKHHEHFNGSQPKRYLYR